MLLNGAKLIALFNKVEDASLSQFSISFFTRLIYEKFNVVRLMKLILDSSIAPLSPIKLMDSIKVVRLINLLWAIAIAPSSPSINLMW